MNLQDWKTLTDLENELLFVRKKGELESLG